MLGDSSHFMGRGVGTSVRAHGAERLFVHVRELLSHADLFFFNLESPVSLSDGINYRANVYRAPAKASSSLKLGALNIASLANNHIRQHGSSVLQETRCCLESVGIAGVGFSPNGEIHSHATRLPVGAFTVSIHCESLIKDCTNEVIDYSRVEDRIASSFSSMPADIQIVSLHWGDEFVPVPSSYQQQLAHRLVERGANMILGHHPHVLQPVEEYKGALIAYSLGNFVFDQRWGSEVETGGILDVELSPEIRNWRMHYTKINHSYQPELLACMGDGVKEPNNGLSQIYQGLTDAQYRTLKSSCSRRFRLDMKWELLRHFWKVTKGTWLLLLSNRWRAIRRWLRKHD